MNSYFVVSENILQVILFILGSFIVGAIPFAFIITKIFSGKDIRTVGSGNPGATNVVRALNIKFGLVVLILDMLKGAVPVYLGIKLGFPAYLVNIVAVAVVLGHDFTPFLNFKGGKGVAASLGIFLVIDYVPTLIVVFIAFLLTSVFKFVSFGSVVASVSYPVLLYVLGKSEYLWLAIILGFLIIWSHRENLRRLWYGEEKESV
ncbi:MAG: glycerol-3-phosphate 1-O-acyltransferase PlsY [Elusimicrobiota bacterium]